MTTFTLITVIAFGLAVALASVAIVLAVILLWTARRVGDLTLVKADVDTLRTQHRNLDEIFESYRKRDATRDSRARAPRKEKEETEEATVTPVIQTRDDIVREFERRNA